MRKCDFGGGHFEFFKMAATQGSLRLALPSKIDYICVNYLYAKFGAFVQHVTVTAIFDRKGPDYRGCIAKWRLYSSPPPPPPGSKGSGYTVE